MVTVFQKGGCIIFREPGKEDVVMKALASIEMNGTITASRFVEAQSLYMDWLYERLPQKREEDGEVKIYQEDSLLTLEYTDGTSDVYDIPKGVRPLKDLVIQKNRADAMEFLLEFLTGIIRRGASVTELYRRERKC